MRENTPTAKFVSIPSLKNINDGNSYANAYPSGGLIIICPKTASEEKVEAAMTYLDWMATVDDFNKCTAAENPVYYDDVVANYENSLTGQIINMPTFTSELQTELTNDFLLLRSKYLVQCITCTPEQMDGIYDEWIEEAKKAGIEDVIAERTAYFEEVYGN